MTWEERRKQVYEIIFEADTPPGRLFDVWLLYAIIASVIAIILHSVDRYQQHFGGILNALEWIFTILFTIEYGLRLWSARNTLTYALSAFGLIDLMALLPKYLDLLFPGMHFLIVVRVFRILRVFRVLKLQQFASEEALMLHSLYQSRRKILVFMMFILLAVTVIGTFVYAVESPYNKSFSSIPMSIYWAIVTLTTVGYGDISPVTDFGRFMAAIVMILGYSVIAVPTGIVSAEIIAQRNKPRKISAKFCHNCSKEAHDYGANFCSYCGEPLDI